MLTCTRELTLLIGCETVLGKRTTCSEYLKANEKRCLNNILGSQPNYVQLNLSNSYMWLLKAEKR